MLTEEARQAVVYACLEELKEPLLSIKYRLSTISKLMVSELDDLQIDINWLLDEVMCLATDIYTKERCKNFHTRATMMVQTALQARGFTILPIDKDEEIEKIFRMLPVSPGENPS